MDETAYRQIYSEIISRPCAFEKAILAGCVACERSARIQIAEREAVTCNSASSLSRCTSLHDSLRQNFSFALHRVQDGTPLPHTQEMRVQCGGLKGLQHVLDGTAEVANVDVLVAFVLQRWGELEEIPYSEVVHAAALCYRGRHG